MSHFTVLCIGEDIDSQLYPYHELECSLSRKEIKKDPRAKFISQYTTEELKKDFIRVKNEYPEHYYKNLKKFANEWHGIFKNNKKDEWGRWTNPNSKWDWYSIGGRWTGFFKIKDNPKYSKDIYIGSPGLMTESAKKGYADSIRICDIDFEGMKKEKIEKAKEYWKEIQKKIAEGDKTVYLIYGVKEGETEQEYIDDFCGFSTYAILKDGEWYAKGEMGWWGVSSNEDENWSIEFEKLIKSLPEDTLLTVVDCHI